MCVGHVAVGRNMHCDMDRGRCLMKRYGCLALHKSNIDVFFLLVFFKDWTHLIRRVDDSPIKPTIAFYPLACPDTASLPFSLSLCVCVCL